MQAKEKHAGLDFFAIPFQNRLKIHVSVLTIGFISTLPNSHAPKGRGIPDANVT
ncbi:MAG: hypothetical protein IAB08_05105 [Bacteroidetes bacterium]|uniref:Uncharacterized protein n=1 Tax=Candidatus Pullibacteroides excrementavium TaxID=2840905 RepID=A0A9D9H166_9BACT|nr:hypothetical protein [Candidatus Pullibacteroides excrementavium]